MQLIFAAHQAIVAGDFAGSFFLEGGPSR